MTPIEWLLSDDTGTSSKTILSVMTGSEMKGWHSADVPHDPSDFGRCHRLLEKFPEWRARLPEVAAKYPMWGPLVREWDSLTVLYLKELAEKTGKARRLYERMKALIDEGRIAAGWERTDHGWSFGKTAKELDLGEGVTMRFGL